MTSSKRRAPDVALLRFRNERGLTREQLAARAGLASRTIFNIERQGVEPQRATLHVLAEALCCEVVDLLNGGGPGATGPPVPTSVGLDPRRGTH
ncbi:MAG: helix-turn-helix domain-containing protein [Solirubrobacteraceae bacterium]